MIQLKNLVKDDLFKEKDKNRDFHKIREFFDLNEKEQYTIDDITWNDLEMDKIYSNIDRTYSSAGESVLYSMLRNPLMNKEKIKSRENAIENFKNNRKLIIDIRCILFKLGFDKENMLLGMLNGMLTINKLKYYIYYFLGRILPIVLVLLAIFLKDTRFMFAFMVVALINCGINRSEERVIQASGINYLRDLINVGKKISRIKDNSIEYYKNDIKGILKDIKNIDKGTLVIDIFNGFGGVFEFLAIPFLIEESTYYKISTEIEKNKDKIYDLFYNIGQIDALSSIAIYKLCNEDRICIPQFVDKKSLKIKSGIHPLLKKSVANDIAIDSKGIVLTGTNMSGKSTFLRMVGANILISQTFNFSFAKEYKAPFFNVVSSISPKDDIDNGKSYYMAEAESLLRIINSLEKDIPVFSLIDEIFRGTNPVERIASSAEILSYINKRDAIVIVATHDRELTDMLNNEYDFYYFSEDVNNKKGLTFDYKIKKGISKTKNAIRLLDYIGYPKEIIKNSYMRCKELEHYI